LKVLTDREVSPQLGLLKSTLLQLDSTFTERDYGAGTFRDFIEKMAAAGYVTLKQVDRSLMVESTDTESPVETVPASSSSPVGDQTAETEPGARVEGPPPDTVAREDSASSASPDSPPRAPVQSSGPTSEQSDECIRNLTDIFQRAKVVPHWPMYLRNVKQYIKNAAPGFDERKFGFTNFLETVRLCQRSGLFRLERNRQGILRVFPGPQFPQQSSIPMSAAEQERAAERAFIAAAEAAIMAAEPMLEAVAPMAPPAEAVEEESTPSPAVEPKLPRRRTTRAPGEAPKRRPAANRTSAAPRRSPRKKPAEPEESE